MIVSPWTLGGWTWTKLDGNARWKAAPIAGDYPPPAISTYHRGAAEILRGPASKPDAGDPLHTGVAKSQTWMVLSCTLADSLLVMLASENMLCGYFAGPLVQLKFLIHPIPNKYYYITTNPILHGLQHWAIDVDVIVASSEIASLFSQHVLSLVFTWKWCVCVCVSSMPFVQY